MKVFLVRHGETASNRDGLGLGRKDVPLTEHGQRQAQAVAMSLADEPLDRVYSSPLQRCRSVAAAIAGERGQPVELRDELLELDVGDTEGMSFAAMRERFPDFLEAWGGPEGYLAAMPGGESLHELATRLGTFVDQLRAAEDTSVAVVTHNFVMRVLLCQLLGLELTAFRSMVVDLASVTILRIAGERVVVERLNDCCHLDALEPHAAPA